MTHNPAHFVLVGAPRCGTTALFQYLSEHPQIQTASPKEPLYWCFDFESYRVIKSRAQYDRIMQPRSPVAAVGEGSTMYLLSQEALPALREYQPQTKILLALRNPVEMFLSWHGWMQQALEENEADPEKAWLLQGERQNGRALPTTSQVPWLVQYREVCHLANHVRRLLDSFPREQIHAIVFEEMIAHPRDTYEGVLRFLGVPSDGRREFPQVNERRTLRNRWATQWYRCPPAALRPVVDVVRRGWLGLPKPVQKPLRSLFFSSAAAKPTLRPEFRQVLIETFTPDVCELQDLLGIDLGIWGYERPTEALLPRRM